MATNQAKGDSQEKSPSETQPEKKALGKRAVLETLVIYISGEEMGVADVSTYLSFMVQSY